MNDLTKVALVGIGGFVAYKLLSNRALLFGPAQSPAGAGTGGYKPAATTTQGATQNPDQGFNWNNLVSTIGSGLSAVISAVGVTKSGTSAQTTSSGAPVYSSTTLATVPDYKLTDPTLDYGWNNGAGMGDAAVGGDLSLVGDLRDPTIGF